MSDSGRFACRRRSGDATDDAAGFGWSKGTDTRHRSGDMYAAEARRKLGDVAISRPRDPRNRRRPVGRTGRLPRVSSGRRVIVRRSLLRDDRNGGRRMKTGSGSTYHLNSRRREHWSREMESLRLGTRAHLTLFQRRGRKEPARGGRSR